MDRLFNKGLITSIIGFIVLIFCGTLIWTEKSTPTDLAGWFLFGTTLLRAKDSILGIDVDEKNPDQ